VAVANTKSLADSMVIGITGHPASGKDSAADFFAAKGFQTLSGGNVLREMMHREGLSVDRTSMREFTKRMRTQRGNAFPAEEIASQITEQNTVISGLRNLAELEIFRKKFGSNFILLAIDADVEVRYERVLGRKRAGDDLTLERFKEEEDAERMEPSGSHEVDRVIAVADHVIKNNGTREEFFEKLGLFLENIPR